MIKARKAVFVVLVLSIAAFAMVNISKAGASGFEQSRHLEFGQVLQRSGSIAEVKIESDGRVIGTFKDGTRFESRGPDLTSSVWSDFMKAMRTKSPSSQIDFAPPSATAKFVSFLSIIGLPLMIFGLISILALQITQRLKTSF